MSDWVFWVLPVIGTLAASALVAIAIRKFGPRRPQLEGLDAAALWRAARERTQRYSAIPIAIGAILFLFLVMNQAFPNFTAGYVAQGGPVWMLLFGALAIGAIVTWTEGTPRALLATPIIGAFILWVVVATVSSWIWGTNTTPATANAPSQNQREVYPDPLTFQANALCNGEKKQMEYKKLPTRVNPNGHCAPGFWHEGHCLYVWQAGKTDEFQKIKVCHKPNEADEKKRYDPMPVDVEFVATADTVFTDYYWLLPRKAVQFFR